MLSQLIVVRESLSTNVTGGLMVQGNVLLKLFLDFKDVGAVWAVDAVVILHMTGKQSGGCKGFITILDIAGKGMTSSHVDLQIICCPQCSCITDVARNSVLL